MLPYRLQSNSSMLVCLAVILQFIAAPFARAYESKRTWDLLKLNSNAKLEFTNEQPSRRDESDFERTESSAIVHGMPSLYERFYIPRSNLIAQKMNQQIRFFKSPSCSGRLFLHQTEIEEPEEVAVKKNKKIKVSNSIHSVDNTSTWLLLRAYPKSDLGLKITRFDLVMLDSSFLSEKDLNDDFTHMQIICDGDFQQAGSILTNELGFDWRISPRNEPKWLSEIYSEHETKVERMNTKKKTEEEMKIARKKQRLDKSWLTWLRKTFQN